MQSVSRVSVCGDSMPLGPAGARPSRAAEAEAEAARLAAGDARRAGAFPLTPALSFADGDAADGRLGTAPRSRATRRARASSRTLGE